MGIKVDGIEPETWDAIHDVARDEALKVVGKKEDKEVQTSTSPDPVLAAVVSAKKKPAKKAKKGGKTAKAKKAVAVLLAVGISALLMVGTSACSSPEAVAGTPMGLIRPRNLDSSYDGTWDFGGVVQAPSFVLEPNPSSAITATEGSFYFDTDAARLKYYDGSAWHTLSGI